MVYGVSIGCTFFAIILICTSSHRHIFQGEPIREGNFSYSNCNTTPVPLYVNYIKVSPDPVRFGKPIDVDFNMTLDKDVGRNDNSIEIDLSFRLKTKKGYTELCRMIGENLCHYNDFCSILSTFMENKTCPPYIPRTYHNNCSCPLEKANYSTQKYIPIPLQNLSFEVRGTFDLTIRLHEEGKILGCFEIHFCITDCKPLEN